MNLLVTLLALSAAVANESPPPIGAIDFYGLKSTPIDQLRQALQIKEGDAPPAATDEIIGRLEALPEIAEARLTFVCCDAGKTILFVGVREKDSPGLKFRPAPQGTAMLGDEILRAGAAKEKAMTAAAKKGDVAEDRSQGHALSANPELRAVQEQFIRYAADDLDELRTVLRTSADPAHRALAAEIIAYAPHKRVVVKTLLHGLRDHAPEVRNNCMRALAVIAEFSRQAPKERIEINPEPFVDLLSSVEWSDRNKAAAALRAMSDTRDQKILVLLRLKAGQSLEEMARWKSAAHAHDAFILLGRVKGVPEAEIRKRWNVEPERRAF